MKFAIAKLISNIEKYEKYLFLLPIVFILKFAGYFAAPWDEPVQRLTGAVNLKYLVKRFGFIDLPNSAKTIPDLDLYPDKVFGPIFEIISICFEWLFQITPKNNLLQGNSDTYFFRHFLTALTCYLLSIYLYKLIALRFANGIAFLVFISFWTTPKFISEAFYNSKDVLLLCILFPFLFYIYKYSRTQKTYTLFSASLFLGIAISIRLSILLIFFTSIIFLVLQEKRQFKNILKYVLGVIFTTIIVWPFLWQDPVNNFFFALKDMLNRNWNGKVLFDGKMIAADNLPWNYLLKWNLITIPILILLGTVFAVTFLIVGIRKIRFTNKYNLTFDYFILLTLIFYHVAFMVLKPTLYDGWRHYYFSYSLIMYLFAYGIFNIMNSRQNYLKKIAIASISIGVFVNCAHIKDSFPLSNLYFNEFVSKDNAHLSWEMDYWGTSNYKILKKLSNYAELGGIEKVTISTNQANPLYINLRMLRPNQAQIFEISNTFNSNTCLYLTNFRMETDLPVDSMVLINQLKINGLTVGNLYANSNCSELWRKFSFKNITN